MPIQKAEKVIIWLHENLPSQIAGVSASVVHKVKVDESVMNINKDVETIIVACVSAFAVFVVRQGCKELWSRLFPKNKDDESNT